MNVRFFAGTKADYLSLPTPRNPLGLYFCADTKELFWADRLLTDGIRVVPTRADLPDLSCAADGTVYYVTETRNGYTLSPDRTEWLQTIYAPATDAYEVPESEIYNTVTTVGAVRDIEAKIYKTIDERIANIEVGTSGNGVEAIYFAGVKLDELDGVYTIDRLCALRALGFVIPEDQDEFELVTKEYVDEQIKAITDVDLGEYAKKTDLAGLATKEELREAIDSIEHTSVDLTGYATEEWVNEQGFAKVSDIPKAELYVVDFNNPNYKNAVEAYNSGKLLLLTNAAPDSNGYAVLNYVSDKYIAFTKFLMSRSGTYGAFNTYYLRPDNAWELAKEVKLNKVEAVAEEGTAELTGLQIGKNTYTFDSYATKEAVTELTQNIENTYVTNETLTQNYITQEEIQNTYVTEQYVTNNYITQEAAEDKITSVVETQVNEVVAKEIETKVTEVIEQKVEAGEITVNADAINYSDFEDDIV